MTTSIELAEGARDEERAARRQLLASPLLTKREDPEGFRRVLRHRDALTRWFLEHVGWSLRVDAGAGVARLFKRPHRPHKTRALSVRGRAFDRRRYTLLCLALAALEEHRGQTTLARIAETVTQLSREDDELAPFDAARRAERRALVDALLWLVEVGALTARDGDVERYASNADADALYDVSERVLAYLIASPVPPALAASSGELTAELYADTDEGRRQRARHHVLRALLDDPVVYYDELAPEAVAWLEQTRGFVYRTLEHDVGLVLERRREGLAAADPAGELADTRFPDGGSTVKHAALLLGALLCERRRRGDGAPREAFPFAEVVEIARALFEEHASHWSVEYAGDDGPALLAAEASSLLESFGLVSLARSSEPSIASLHIRPALARFAPTRHEGRR